MAKEPQVPVADVQVPTSTLSYQLEMLKLEIETINGIVDRIDGITQTTKNWAVVTWAGGLGLALQHQELRRFVILTAALPLLFWYIDAVWRRLQARSTYRIAKIREFLNDERLSRSFSLGRLCDFSVLDPVGTQYKGTAEYEQHVRLGRTLRYREIRVFYLVPALLSAALGLFFLLRP